MYPANGWWLGLPRTVIIWSYCIQLTEGSSACDGLWLSGHIVFSPQTVAQLAMDCDHQVILYSAHRQWLGLRWIMITRSFCIQLIDGGFVCKLLQVSKNLTYCGQLKIVGSGIGISSPYCIQLTNSCLVCNGLRVSENLTIC